LQTEKPDSPYEVVSKCALRLRSSGSLSPADAIHMLNRTGHSPLRMNPHCSDLFAGFPASNTIFSRGPSLENYLLGFLPPERQESRDNAQAKIMGTVQRHENSPTKTERIVDPVTSGLSAGPASERRHMLPRKSGEHNGSATRRLEGMDGGG